MRHGGGKSKIFIEGPGLDQATTCRRYNRFTSGWAGRDKRGDNGCDGASLRQRPCDHT